MRGWRIRLAALLGASGDVVIVQAEAIVALEAAAASLSRPGLSALNIVTSPYGLFFGDWLRRGGATVTDVLSEPGMPVIVDKVARALDAKPAIGLVAMVHAETSSGILNPLEEIAKLVKARQARCWSSMRWRPSPVMRLMSIASASTSALSGRRRPSRAPRGSPR